MNIGFIGLGIMGKPMARNLIKAGYSLIVCDHKQSAIDEIAACGCTGIMDIQELARRSDVIITMLPNSPQVKEVMLGATILIDMSSIAPLVSKEIAARLAEKDIYMLDAPVSGGEPKAVDGTLAIMVGGPADIFEKCREILLAMGTSVTRVGEIGSGNMAKLANQIMVAANIAGMSEALTLAVKAGVNPETVYQAVRGGLAGSTVLDAKAPMVMAGNFKPGFRINLHIKDLQNALDTAEGLDSPAPLSALIIDMMRKLDADGHGGDDHGGLIQYYEAQAGVEVRK